MDQSYIDKILQTFDICTSWFPVNLDAKLVACENSEGVHNQQMYQAIVGKPVVYICLPN